jgi:hypothetical protein
MASDLCTAVPSLSVDERPDWSDLLAQINKIRESVGPRVAQCVKCNAATLLKLLKQIPVDRYATVTQFNGLPVVIDERWPDDIVTVDGGE